VPDGTSRFSCDGAQIMHYMGCSTFANYTVPYLRFVDFVEDWENPLKFSKELKIHGNLLGTQAEMHGLEDHFRGVFPGLRGVANRCSPASIYEYTP
jgi:hypothetical protein